MAPEHAAKNGNGTFTKYVILVTGSLLTIGVCSSLVFWNQTSSAIVKLEATKADDVLNHKVHSDILFDNAKAHGEISTQLRVNDNNINNINSTLQEMNQSIHDMNLKIDRMSRTGTRSDVSSITKPPTTVNN